MSAGTDWIVAAVVGTEVPPEPTGTFTAAMIPIALAAVCDVIANRVASGRFPPNAVEVVLQKNQFSAVCRQDYWQLAMAGVWFPSHLAAALAEWQRPRGLTAPGALYYYSPISMDPPGAKPSWLAGKTEVLVAGLDTNYFRFFTGG
jgi:spore germination cell wall hydrolase CwlJ-like protein